MPQFEFDEDKSRANFEKHGIDFIDAQKLWNDKNRVVITAKSENETRFALIAQLDDRFWTAICTQRGMKIRIISVRRSRDDEKQIYIS